MVKEKTLKAAVVSGRRGLFDKLRKKTLLLWKKNGFPGNPFVREIDRSRREEITIA